MKRILAFAAVVACIAVGSVALAHEHEGHSMSGAEAKPRTLTGEVVDLGCWLGHAAKGAKHASCAAKCVNQGMPMGLLTPAGKLYLVTMDHDNADPYNSLKTFAGKNATITGEVMARNGMTAIEATKVQAAGR